MRLSFKIILEPCSWAIGFAYNRRDRAFYVSILPMLFLRITVEQRSLRTKRITPTSGISAPDYRT